MVILLFGFLLGGAHFKHDYHKYDNHHKPETHSHAAVPQEAGNHSEPPERTTNMDIATRPFSVFWPLLAFVVGFILSLRTTMAEPSKSQPNDGIWRTLANSLRLGAEFGIFSGILLMAAIWMLHPTEPHRYVSGFGFGVFCGLPVAMWFGLRDFLHHFALRFILWFYGYAPWNYARFLNHATDRIFLRKVGDGYIFVHRLLLEHFAADEKQLHLLFKKATPQQQA